MDKVLILVAFTVFALIGFGCTAFLRDYGVDTCRERGGTPVLHSWFSESNWDVSCIEVPHGN